MINELLRLNPLPPSGFKEEFGDYVIRVNSYEVPLRQKSEELGFVLLNNPESYRNSEIWVKPDYRSGTLPRHFLWLRSQLAWNASTLEEHVVESQFTDDHQLAEATRSMVAFYIGISTGVLDLSKFSEFLNGFSQEQILART